MFILFNNIDIYNNYVYNINIWIGGIGINGTRDEEKNYDGQMTKEV
jgi:hypothetical protein